MNKNLFLVNFFYCCPFTNIYFNFLKKKRCVTNQDSFEIFCCEKHNGHKKLSMNLTCITLKLGYQRVPNVQAKDCLKF